MLRLCFYGLVMALGLTAPSNVFAQALDTGTTVRRLQSPILTMEPNKLLTQTLFGRRMFSEFEALRDEIQKETTQLESVLIAEEQKLTDMRGTVSAEEFRALADAFDTKAQGFRQQTEDREADLAQRIDAAERQLLQAALPVLNAIMREAGAAVVVDRRSVFLSADAIDITDLVIRRLDETLGDGSSLTPEVEPQD